MEKYQINFTAGLAGFLFENNSSILLTTYQAGVLMAIGSSDGAKLHQIPFRFKKPMGIALQDNKLAIATLDEIQLLSNAGSIEKDKKNNSTKFDTFFVHRATYNTCSLDVHDLDFGKGSIWGINTSFSCLCKFDINYSFVPKWKPKFISDLVPEDKCHLNGMAMQGDTPKFVTALSQTDQKEGWRKDLMNTGVLMEVPSGDILLDGLAMPHSPTIIGEKVYFLESGKGCISSYDIATGTKKEVYLFSRFVRGMSQLGDHLIIGVSKIRESSKTFKSLRVSETSTDAGIIVFNFVTNQIDYELEYETTIDEIYDVQVLNGFNRPAVLSQLEERSKEVIISPQNTFWKKAKEKE
ncbi:MAG: hypothetical protein ACI8Q1_001805 [Parvicella sp.]|jgi:uncharacterized protein (TIGR03032 family)